MKLITDINLKKELKYGKNLNIADYRIDYKSSELIKILEYINLKKENNKEFKESNIFDYLDLEDLGLILNLYQNQYVNINNNEYFVTQNINDIVLHINKLDNQKIAIELNKLKNYKILNSNLIINNINKTVYLITNENYSKLKFLENIMDDNEESNPLIFDKEVSAEFLEKILPSIYNEFNISLDTKFGYEIIEEKLIIKLSAYFQKNEIKIKPQFLYGNYDASEIYKNKLIKRNIKKEMNLINNLINQGYYYDYILEEFSIILEKSQFIFLTKNLFELKQQYDVNLDEDLKKAIMNFDSRQISINIKGNQKENYFEFEYDLGSIKKSEINEIIKAFTEEKDFYKLASNKFLKLNDQKVYEQLLFVNDIMESSKQGMNSYRIPKYRALLIKEEIKNKFSKYTFGQEFENYIESIRLIEPLAKKKFENKYYKLRNYQKEGINLLNTLYEAQFGGLLADEMGLGKTLQIISFLQIKEINSGLIVLPKALLYNWKYEFEKFNPNQKVIILEGSQKQREDKLLKNYKDSIILTSYNSIIRDYKQYETLKFKVVIIDEAQYIKNPQTKTAKCVKLLQGDFYIALSGTPIENNLLEYWSIFDFIIPGYLETLNKFKKKYKIENGNIKNIEILKKATAPFILRRLKKDVLKELPDKIESNIYCEMEEKQAEIYNVMVENYKDKIKSILTLGEFDKKNIEILSYITRLRQAAIDPALINKNEYTEKSGKIEVFNELINNILESKEKILVFSQYTTMLERLGKELQEKKIKYFYLDGKTRPKQRLMDVEKFNKGNIPVYLISLKAGGVGLNLTSATNVIIFDPWWNPAIEEQAIDRSHRIGQKDKVNVYRLISRGSIEEKIINLKNNKKKIISDILDLDNKLISEVGKEELINLLI